jgi:hypothetical protein
MTPRRRSRPSRAALHDAEATLRTLDAYVGVLQGRLALARLSRRRAEFEQVTDGDLALLAIHCQKVTDALDAILGRISPELAASAAAVADVEHHRAFTRPRPPAAGHLRVVEGDRGA